MKRKIGIIIAALAIASGIAASGILGGSAHAATWCSVDQDNSSTYGEAAQKRCAHIVLIDHGDDTFTKTIQSGYMTTTDATKRVADWCTTGYAQQCTEILNSVISFKASQQSSVQTSAPGKDAFVTAVYNEVRQGKTHVDPCAGVMGTSGENYCLSGSGNKNWMYYQSAAPAGYVPSSGGSGGSGGSGSGSGSGGSEPGATGSKEPEAETGNCTSILTFISCNKEASDDSGNGITQMIRFVISVMTGAVVIAGTIGIIICGVMMITARDNEAQMTKARSRLIEIVIGIVAWALIAVLINFFIPRTESQINTDLSVNTTLDEEKEA